ncbi:MAG: hypothetical protein OEO18_18860 [Gammaproteobacteria bacterium]|nr:hypothetical protein [Gammaproteobacteria bacterium]
MKLKQPKQTRMIGGVASLALLLALTGCGGSGTDEIAAEAKGPPANSNSQGASIGVSNLCWVEGTNPATLFVETTITDKSSGEEVPVFESVQIQPLQKVKNQETKLGEIIPADVVIADLNKADAIDPVTRQYATFVTGIDLCAAGLTIDATSVNANLRVQLFNSNNTYTNSKCTAMVDGGLKIGGMGLCQ